MNPFQVDYGAAVAGPQDALIATAGELDKLEQSRAEAPIRQRLLGAQAANLESEAAKRSADLERSGELRALFKGFNFDPSQPQSKMLTDMAARLMPYDPIAGEKALVRASEAELREERGARATEEAAKARSIAVKRGWEMISSLMGSATEPEAFRQNQLLAMTHPEVQANPQLRDWLASMTPETYARTAEAVRLELAARDRAIREGAEARRAREGATRAGNAAARIDIARTRNRIAEERDAGRTKDTGPKPQRASAEERKRALAFIRNAPELSGLGETARVNLAGDLAARVATMRAARPQVPEDVLRAEALKEIRDSGAIIEKNLGPISTGKGYVPFGANVRPPAAAAKEKVRPGEAVARDAAGNKMVVRGGKWVPAE